MKKTIDLLTALGLPSLPSHNPDTIAALLWAREVVQQQLTTTYRVRSSHGIEELKPVKIGGVDQWLHIRGRNRSNPILLYIHGGPGAAFIGFMDATQRPWEDYFTIVQWDQRQTGKSYYSASDDQSLTIQQLVNDTEEVVDYLRHYLNQEKLFLLGHSWGSVLGMHIAKNKPNWLYAYIGIGQVVNVMKAERIIYERLFSHAKEQKERRLINKLDAMAPYPDPNNLSESFVENGLLIRWELSRLAGEAGMRHLPVDEMMKMWNFSNLTSPHLTLADISNSILGDQKAIMRAPYTFTSEYMAIDLPQDLGSSFQVPVFFFTGVHDWQTPRLLSDQWFSEISAPEKTLVHFEESSHFVVNEEPGRVLNTLVNKVLPLAKYPMRP